MLVTRVKCSPLNSALPVGSSALRKSMRILSLAIAFLVPSVCFADCPTTSCSSCATPCSSCAPANPCVTNVVYQSACRTCPKWPDYATFQQQFYAEFYARNPWYLEQKKLEAQRKAKGIAKNVTYSASAETDDQKRLKKIESDVREIKAATVKRN